MSSVPRNPPRSTWFDRPRTEPACDAFVAEFWNAGLATDEFKIQSLATVDHRAFLRGCLSGKSSNAETTQLFCYFDYLRDSRDPIEREAGERVWIALQTIVAAAVPDGELREVRRTSFQPIVRQHGIDLTLDQLSSGSHYVISRMLRLLQRMYSCAVLRGMPAGEVLTETPGILLIDEAENHLHPKWQKRFIPDIRSVFPNLQIIAATHSPFVVSSVVGAKVYRCRALEGADGCTVEDVTDDYANQPVDEVLASEAFAGTLPYRPALDALIEQRKRAIEAGDDAERERIELELVALNPDAFGVYRIAELLKELGQAS